MLLVLVGGWWQLGSMATEKNYPLSLRGWLLPPLALFFFFFARPVRHWLHYVWHNKQAVPFLFFFPSCVADYFDDSPGCCALSYLPVGVVLFGGRFFLIIIIFFSPSKVWVVNKTGVSLAYRASMPSKDDDAKEKVFVRRPNTATYRTDSDTMLFSRYVHTCVVPLTGKCLFFSVCLPLPVCLCLINWWWGVFFFFFFSAVQQQYL